MPQIKSSIELAMEKTKNLRLSQEEMEKFKEEELQSKAHSLVNRFLEVDYHFREVERELSRHDSNQRKQIEKLMLQYLSESIQFDRDNELIFKGIGALRQDSEKIINKIQELIEGYEERKGKEYEGVERDLLKKFEQLGISGSAVTPKLEGSKEWNDAIEQFKPTFEEQLRILKEEVRKY